MGLSHLTLPTAQGPRTEPGLEFMDRNGGSPSTPTLHWAGSSAGLAYLRSGGRGWTPQERYRLREGPVLSDKAQMTFALWPGLSTHSRVQAVTSPGQFTLNGGLVF